jgi:hypothetical protein
MKTRIGFVSNSSTTSFCIYGAEVSDAIADKIESDETTDLTVEYGDPNGDGEKYAGISWTKVKDDETGLQFKTRVEEEIRKFVGKTVKCRTIEEAYRDG